jgi:hypothetical protein
VKPADILAWTIVAVGVLPVLGKTVSAIWRAARRAA